VTDPEYNFQNTIAIVLAAGKGKRMKSDLPKVLHPLGGRPLIAHLVTTLNRLRIGKIVLVVGHGRELVEEHFANARLANLFFALQETQRGTADAVNAAAEFFREHDGSVLVLAGDVPLLRESSLEKLLNEHTDSGCDATVLTSEPPDPTGYGRIIRGETGLVKKIVEHADADESERAVGEINTGIFAFQAKALYQALQRVDTDNEQGEYYLTDVVEILLHEGNGTRAVKLDDYREALGVNSVEQLRELEEIYAEVKQ
jgi:bifunctional UDP-N-acetylglucosamine pyrophosphorylase/glucosamine-1-phosphate N-acetyltransferase